MAARAAAEQLRIEYNEVRPHSALGYRNAEGVRRTVRIQPTLTRIRDVTSQRRS